MFFVNSEYLLNSNDQNGRIGENGEVDLEISERIDIPNGKLVWYNQTHFCYVCLEGLPAESWENKSLDNL